MAQAVFILDFLQNKFLLNRLAVARGLSDGQGLLDTAMQMIEITNMFWIRREHLIDFSFQFDWFVSLILSMALIGTK